MSEKTQKMKANVALLKKELEKIKNLYSQDGTIDASEQQHIDSLLATIAKCEQKLSKVKNNDNDQSNDTSVDFKIVESIDKLKKEILSKKDEIEKVISAMEAILKE